VRLAEAELVALYPETQYLLDLRDAGWSFQPQRIDGEPVIVGFRSWPTHTDAIWVFGRTRCLGIRTLDNAPGVAGGMVWMHESDLAAVIHEILALPAPGARLAPSPVLPRTTANILWTP